jgi:gluconate 2-dehydrogenase alpha chain
MKALPPVDVVIVGGGWTGLLMAKELGSRTALSVVVLERGGARQPEDYANGMDELDYAIRMRMMQDLSQETVTFRHTPQQRALPLRQHGSFLPGTGTGGAGEHWAGWFPRFVPDSFELLSRTVEEYGPSKLPEDHSIQDWGITYDDLEPHYTRAELLLGISGKAGNLRGKRIEGGNIFEGWRSAEYPTPPTKIPYVASLFGAAAKSLGYHPYPIPAATTSVTYTNPDGVSRPGCAYCGFCDRFGCMIGAKAQPTNVLLPVIQPHGCLRPPNQPCWLERQRKCDRRDLRGFFGRGNIPTRWADHPRILDPQQYPSSPTFRSRRILRPRKRQGQRRPQSNSPDSFLGHSLL